MMYSVSSVAPDLTAVSFIDFFSLELKSEKWSFSATQGILVVTTSK